jgi:hypothetical protein
MGDAKRATRTSESARRAGWFMAIHRCNETTSAARREVVPVRAKTLAKIDLRVGEDRSLR